MSMNSFGGALFFKNICGYSLTTSYMYVSLSCLFPIPSSCTLSLDSSHHIDCLLLSHPILYAQVTEFNWRAAICMVWGYLLDENILVPIPLKKNDFPPPSAVLSKRQVLCRQPELLWDYYCSGPIIFRRQPLAFVPWHQMLILVIFSVCLVVIYINGKEAILKFTLYNFESWIEI